MPTSQAERARLAHRVLRLRENGIDSESRLLQIANLAGPRRVAPEGEDQSIGGGGHPLANLAAHTADFLEADRPGTTDRKLTERLFGYSLTDIWKAWDDAVTANVESLLEPAQLKEWRESVARDQAEFDDKAARMAESGDWPVHPAFGHNRHSDGAANALYDLGREGFLAAEIDWDTAVIKVALADSAVYTVNLATHKFMSSVASVVATSAALTTKTIAAGVADGDDFAFATVTGAVSEALLFYQSSAVGGGADVANTLQRLIGYYDTATGLPVTPNGGNINVVFDSGSNRIFKL